MNSKKWLLIVILFPLAFSTASASDYSDGRPELDYLRGLRGEMYVVVQPLSPWIVGKGFTTEQIKTDVELKLRLAGIKVMPFKELPGGLGIRVPGSPYLYVKAYVMSNVAGIVVFKISIALYEDAILKRDHTIGVSAPTWSTEGMETVQDTDFGSIRNRIKDRMDQFINDYLMVNPKGGK